MGLEERIRILESSVQEAIDKSNYGKRDVDIVAVTKTIPVQLMREAIACGLVHLGENRVQELSHKMGKMDERVKWHMIGHLQRNKVKYIIDKVSLIHSLDSIRLAKEISDRAIKNKKTIDCLIQINTGDEDNKYGLHIDECESFLETLQDLEGIQVRGLMAVTPFFADPEKSRPYFRQMKAIYDTIAEKKYKNTKIDYLSMGMSNDYQVAIEEGATMVRIGSLFFGQ